MTCSEPKCIETINSFRSLLNSSIHYVESFNDLPAFKDVKHVLLDLRPSICPNYYEEITDRNQDVACDPLYWQESEPIQKLSDFLQKNLTRFDDIRFAAKTIKTVQQLLPDLTPSWLKDNLHEYYKYYLAHLKSLHATPLMVKVRGGLLMSHIVDNMEKVVQNDPKGVKSVVFSGSDHNLYSLAYMLGIRSYIPWIPDALDAMAVELHENNRRLFVKVFYIVKELVVLNKRQLVIPHCGEPCPYDKFKVIMKDYEMNEDKFYELCTSKDARMNQPPIECLLT